MWYKYPNQNIFPSIFKIIDASVREIPVLSVFKNMTKYQIFGKNIIDPRTSSEWVSVCECVWECVCARASMKAKFKSIYEYVAFISFPFYS